MRIVITSRIDSKNSIELARSIGWDLQSKGHDIKYETSVADEIGYSGVSLSGLTKDNTDLVLILGGDGSVLRAVRLMKNQIPVIGINQGTVGFLTDLDPEYIDDVLDSLALPLKVEPRMRMSVEYDGRSLGDSLNEVLIVTNRPAKILDFHIFVDGKKIEEFRADGIIIGTPTGSTAYAMSAGGPIVDSTIEAILMVPIAPYMLSSRPYLVNSNKEVIVKLVADKPALLVIDGQDRYDIGENSSVIIRKSPDPALFVDIGRDFFDKVGDKLRIR